MAGEPLVTHVFGRGSTVGEVEAFMTKKVEYTVKALTDCSLCSIPNKILFTVCEGNPDLLKDIIRAAGSNQGSPGHQIWVLSAHDLSERLHRQFMVLASYYLEKTQQGWIELDLSHEDIAFLVNSSRTSVTHALQALVDKGFVKLGYGKVYLKKAVYKLGRDVTRYPFTTWQVVNKPWVY
jgi:CRP-like cAMP-binding protein